jgi:hypothetical protein
VGITRATERYQRIVDTRDVVVKAEKPQENQETPKPKRKKDSVDGDRWKMRDDLNLQC